MKQNQQKSKEQQATKEKRLNLYSSSLCIEGEFVIEGDQVTINNKSFDEKELIKWVALYNAFYKDTPITIEELMAEFDAFCHGMKESELLENYRDRMTDIVVRAENVELFVNGYDYDRVIVDHLKEKFDTRLSDATKEQMEEACPHAAEEFYNEVLRLETLE
ncbi:MAG: hypothetical protein E7257_03530 [Lachnospiraceae bacterium]|nr:hypothetical protein [Lachnospiraceae bacterium]